jgi:hypothetical protein
MKKISKFISYPYTVVIRTIQQAMSLVAIMSTAAFIINGNYWTAFFIFFSFALIHTGITLNLKQFERLKKRKAELERELRRRGKL